MEDKNKIREYAEKIAAGITPEQRKGSDTAIFRSLASLSEVAEARVVFCFVGVDSEPDTLPLIRALLRTGRRVVVPRCKSGGRMDAVEITSENDLRPGKFGIPEPPADAPVFDKAKIDAAVVPGVAFDIECGRLGRGGGYYDRWLADFGGFKCGVCRDRLLAQQPLPRGEFDIRMDAVVTDRRILRRDETLHNTVELPAVPPRDVVENEERTARIAREQLGRIQTGRAEDAEAADIEAAEKLPPRRTYRSRRRGGGVMMGCMRALIWFLLVIGISAGLAGFAWLCADDLLSLTSESEEVVITVRADDEVVDVAYELQDKGLIKYPWLFRLFGIFAHADEKIEPGTYTLDKVMDYRALVSAMRQRSAYRTTVNVTIPEGFTVEQILQRLAEKGVNTYEELSDTCANHDFEYSFLADIPLGAENRLEGYLFPDTYTFYVGENPISAMDKLLANFSRKMTNTYREKAEELGYTIEEILVIASLIEKEAADTSEMSTISSVIHNRLNSQYYPKLQIDATIQYILEERKAQLSYEDLQIDNPYNTYVYEGLPPGPICCPGNAAIKAALYPKTTKYYFYALTTEGVHEFARTAEEHQKIIEANPEVYGSR